MCRFAADVACVEFAADDVACVEFAADDVACVEFPVDAEFRKCKGCIFFIDFFLKATLVL